MVSTVLDLAKWDAALYGDRILPQSRWKEAWTRVKLNGDKGTFGYGYAWFLGEMNKVPVLEHGGDIPGYNAQILRVPSKKLTVIVLCNADPGIAQAVGRGVAVVRSGAHRAVRRRPRPGRPRRRARPRASRRTP